MGLKLIKRAVSAFLVVFLILVVPCETFAARSTGATQQTNAQRTKDWNALAAYSRKYPKQLPGWKAKAVFSVLDRDGFFAMNRTQKFAYIHTHIQNSLFLALIAQAEGIFSRVTYQNNAQSVSFIISQKDAALVWYKFIHDLYTTNGQFDSKKYLSRGITNKSYWSKENLDLLYSALWTDLKNNRNLKEFTCQEKKRLTFLNARDPGIIEKFLRGVSDFIIPVTISADNKPSPQVLDVLNFIPIPVVGRWAKRGLGLAKSPIEKAVYRLAPAAAAQTEKSLAGKVGVAVRRLVTRTTPKRVSKVLPSLIRTINGYKFDLGKVFAHAKIPAGANYQRWMKIMEAHTRAMRTITDSSLLKPFLTNHFKATRTDQYFIESMKVRELPLNVAGHCTWGRGSVCEFNEVYLTKNFNYTRTFTTAIHEFLHGFVSFLAERSIYRSPSGKQVGVVYTYTNKAGKVVKYKIKDEYGFGYSKLEESMTDFIAAHLSNCKIGQGSCGYGKSQVGVTGAITSALSRKAYLTGQYNVARARGVGSYQVTRAYMTFKNIEQLDDDIGIKGIVKKVAELLEQGRDQEAIEMINGLYSVGDANVYKQLYWGVSQYY